MILIFFGCYKREIIAARSYNLLIMAAKYSLAQRVDMVLFYAANNDNSRVACNKFHEKYPELQKPSNSTIVRLIAKFKATGSVADKSRSGQPMSAQNEKKKQMF